MVGSGSGVTIKGPTRPKPGAQGEEFLRGGGLG